MTDVGVLISVDNDSTKPRPELDYTSRDFTAIRSQLVGLARGIMPEWSSVGDSADFGTLILELFAYMGDTLNFYIDRTASEAFLGTAIRSQSVMNIADMLGYIPIGQHAASVTLTFKMNESLDPAHPLPDVTMPRGTRVHNSNSSVLVVFETQELLTISPGGSVDIFATEGITVRDSLLGTCFGAPNADFTIQDTGVIYGTVEVVTIEGFQTVRWNYVSDLSLARPNQTVFTTYQDEKNRTHVVFGDNAAGRIPSVNSQVYANYRFGVGAAANDLTTDSLTTIIPPPDVSLQDISVTNADSPIGGSDPESVDSIRFSVPRAGARIRNRAVTLTDYADLAMQVPGVAKSVSYGTVYTSVRVRIAPVGMDQDDAAMDRLCKAVDQYLTDKILIGSSVYVEPPKSNMLWQPVFIRMVVHVVETYNRTSVREQVDAVIRKILAYDIVDFGTRVTVGSIYRAVLSVAGVEYADLRWLSPNEPPDIDPDAPSGGGGGNTSPLFSGTWQYNTSVATGNPTTRHHTLNDPTTITRITFSKNDNTDTDKGANLLGLKVGDHIVMRPMANTTSWRSFIVTARTDNTSPLPGWVDVTVVANQSADVLITPALNDPILFDFLRFTPNPVSVGAVADIVTDELLIPRIDTTEVVEENVDEIQLLTPGGTISGGQWKLTFILPSGTYQTADIAYNATSADIKAAINTAYVANTIQVVSNATSPLSTDPINTTAMKLTFVGYGHVSPVTVQAGTTPLTGAGAVITPSTFTEGATNIYVEAGYTEDERTHDGLWVIAHGGLANT